jgi:hypothetical protein
MAHAWRSRTLALLAGDGFEAPVELGRLCVWAEPFSQLPAPLARWLIQQTPRVVRRADLVKAHGLACRHRQHFTLRRPQPATTIHASAAGDPMFSPHALGHLRHGPTVHEPKAMAVASRNPTTQDNMMSLVRALACDKYVEA